MSSARSLVVLLLVVCLLGCVAGSSAYAAPPRPPGPGAVGMHDAPAGSGTWPLEPPSVLRDFDPPSSAYGAGHRGVDLIGRAGEPVRATLAGRITFAGSLAGRGVVVVDHGTTRTTYEPVRASVEVGDRVPRGGGLGHLQSVGSHCAPVTCLHWGLIETETYLDPLTLVGAGPVRLLPFLDGAPTPGSGPTWPQPSGPPTLPSESTHRLPAPPALRRPPSSPLPQAGASVFGGSPRVPGPSTPV